MHVRFILKPGPRPKQLPNVLCTDEKALGYLSFKDLSGYNISVEDAGLAQFL